MTEREFAHALARWGPDLTRWPEASARRAGHYLAVDRSARRHYAATRAGTAWLRELPGHRPCEPTTGLPERKRRPLARLAATVGRLIRRGRAATDETRW
ncbi:MAG: hypothetical protein ACODAC_01420 [Pseudomonadota bacterium]